MGGEQKDVNDRRPHHGAVIAEQQIATGKEIP